MSKPGYGFATDLHPSRRRDEWLTPRKLLDVLGEFDLDPCGAKGWPTAKKTYYTRGLDRPWFGRVWLNPPYSDLPRWLQALASHGAGTALTFARTDTSAFHQFGWKEARGMLFIQGRLFFHDADGTRSAYSGGAPSVLIAYGERDAARLQRLASPVFQSDRHVRGFYVDLPRPRDANCSRARHWRMQ